MIETIKKLNKDFGVSAAMIARRSGVSYHVIRNFLSDKTIFLSSENSLKLFNYLVELREATKIKNKSKKI